MVFARYVRDMLAHVACSRISCNVGSMIISILAYADDIVLLAPSWDGLQQLLDIVMQQSGVINMSLNQSVWFFVMSCFPEFYANGEKLQYVISCNL